MLLAIIDGNGVLQTRIVAGQETIVDRSTTIAEGGVAQELMAENTSRSGFFIQNANPEGDPIWLNELGDDATETSPSIMIPAGGTFSSFSYPLTTNALSIIGTVDSVVVAREW